VSRSGAFSKVVIRKQVNPAEQEWDRLEPFAMLPAEAKCRVDLVLQIMIAGYQSKHLQHQWAAGLDVTKA
jgi:hypothetical protein